MATELRAAAGKLAIWKDASDALPFTDPLNHIDRLKFHSSLDYVKIIDVKTFTFTAPEVRGVLERVASYTLGAHGRPGIPFFIAKIVVNGVPVAFSGSVPTHASNGLVRWLAIGADATNIIVHEYSIQSGTAGAPDGMDVRPAQTFTVVCYVTDILL